MKYTIERDDSKDVLSVQSELDCAIKPLGQRTSIRYHVMGNHLTKLVNELDVDGIRVRIRIGERVPVMAFNISVDAGQNIIEDRINKANCQWKALLVQFVNFRQMFLLHEQMGTLPNPTEQAPF